MAALAFAGPQVCQPSGWSHTTSSPWAQALNLDSNHTMGISAPSSCELMPYDMSIL
jgi:hypothetical protein